MDTLRAPELVPVMAGRRCIEMAGASRVRHLLKAPNMRAVRRRRDGRVVEIQLLEVGDDSVRKPRRGNPLKYSHKQETEDNPTNVWTLKQIPDKARLAALKRAA